MASPRFSTQTAGSYERKEWKQELHDQLLRAQAATVEPGPVAMEIAVTTGVVLICRGRYVRGLRGSREQAQCLGMMNFTELASVPSDRLVPITDQLRLAVAAYLARFKGSSREYTESDLRCFLAWCTERGQDPLAARRPHLELYIRWMQEIRRFKPSTVSRRFSATAGFYRTCVIDGVLEHSPAEHVRRPVVPAESPTWGSPTCSSRPCSRQPASHRTCTTSPWWRCSGCSACGSSRPPARTSPISGKNMATGCCGFAVRGARLSLSRCHQRSAGPSTGPWAAGMAGRSC